MIDKWYIAEPESRRRGCIVALPGRAVPGDLMMKFVRCMGLPYSQVVVLEPRRLVWYPQPNGAYDQAEAVAGLKDAVIEVEKRLKSIQRAFRIKRRQIAVVGFSAGSVVALQLLASSERPFAAVASFAGAILEPDLMPDAPTQTPVLLRHAVDDTCFSWDERYLPMKKALIDRGYNLYTSEKDWGGHGMTIDDARSVGRFCAPYLGYKDIVDED